MRKRILVLAPSSYPTFGAEAIVNIKLLKALSDSGKFDIDLVSQKVNWYHYPNEELNVKFESLNVIETSLKLTPRLVWEHFYAFFKFGVTFKAVHWAVKAYPVIKKLLKEKQYDYILTKDSPSLVLGNYIKRKYGIKWVATWNDPFPPIKYPVPYGEGCMARGTFFDRKCISVMQNADMHIFPSDRLRNYMLKYLDVDCKKTIVIPHIILDTDVKNDLGNQCLRIIHSGTLQHPRSPQTFLRAFAKFKKLNPDSRMEIDILGIMEEEDKALISELKIQDFVRFLPPVTYSESLELLSKYHIALIIEADCEEGIFLPTKVTDFLQFRKPIFSVSPVKGVLNDLYKDGYIKYFADVRDVEQICTSLSNIYNDFLSGTIKEQVKCASSVFSEKTIINQYYKL